MSIWNQYSLENVLKHIYWLKDHVPERLSGTDQERVAAEYLKDQLESFGIKTKLNEFKAYISIPEESSLLVQETGELIRSQVFAHSVNTPPEGIEGEVIYLGAGGIKDYQGKDASGKIVLVELSYAPPRPEKVRLATIHNAKAVMMMNWGTNENLALPRGTVKPVWGNPEPDDFKVMPTIPCIGISRYDGERLISLVQNGKVRVRIHTKATNEWRNIIEPIGTIPGKDEPEEFLILGGHYDAWGGGITCNATGNAVVLELARIFSLNRDLLHRSIKIAFWPGHENAIMSGSTWFIDTFWDDINKNAIAYFNVDSPGLRGANRYVVYSSPELAAFHQEVEAKVLPEEKRERSINRRLGDHSFFGIGVPSIYGRYWHDETTIREWRGATLGWWYHSELDTIDKMDVAVLEKNMMGIGATVEALCQAKVLPIEFYSASKEILQRLELLNSYHIIDLSNLIEKAKLMVERTHDMEILKQKLQCECDDLNVAKIQSVNNCLKKLSRILTPAYRTESGRYAQDYYGLTSLDTLIPSLFPLQQIAEGYDFGDKYDAVLTRIIRGKNRLCEAIDSAVEEIDNCLARIIVSPD